VEAEPPNVKQLYISYLFKIGLSSEGYVAVFITIGS
jgi:hypothetical protein